MIQSASIWFRTVAQAAIAITTTLMLSGCTVGHSMAGAGGPCGECGCGECALQHVENDMHYANTFPTTGDYRNNYPYPATAQDAPLRIPPQHPHAGQPVHRHQPPAPAPPEIPPANMHANTPLAPTQLPTLDTKARTECAQLKKQTATMQAQLAQLQKQIADDKQTRETLNQSLVSVNGKVSNLSSELNYWKREVQRIDADAEAQHRDDMATLQSISEIISQLPQPATAAAAELQRY